MDGIAAYQKASFPAIADEIEKVFAELLRQAPRPLPWRVLKDETGKGRSGDKI